MTEMNPRDDSDFLTALAIGAVVGIGAALLFRASDDLDRDEIIKRLKPLKKKAGRAMHRARRDITDSARGQARKASRKVNRKMSDAAGAGRILKKSSGRIAHDVGDDVSRIVADAKRELAQSARDSVRQARRAMRKAARKMA